MFSGYGLLEALSHDAPWCAEVGQIGIMLSARGLQKVNVFTAPAPSA